MRKVRRLILALVIFFSLGGVGWKVYTSVQAVKQEIKKNPIAVLDQLPESSLHMRDFHRAKIEEGRKVWEISGEEARYFKEQKEAIIKKPKFSYYDKKGEPAQVVGHTAKLFFNDKELEKMELTGEIEVTYKGYLLRSEEAIYSPDKQFIHMPRRTTVATDGLESEGSSMEVELETKKVRLLGNVKTKIEPGKLSEKKKNQPKVSQISGG